MVNMWSVTVIWEKANLTFAQYIVFAEDMYESAVNNNAEDFPKVTVDAYPMVVGSNLSPLLWIDVINPWFQNLP